MTMFQTSVAHGKSTFDRDMVNDIGIRHGEMIAEFYFRNVIVGPYYSMLC